MSAVVYRCYDADDRLIYVGSTSNFPQRSKYHRNHAEWWADVTRIEQDAHERLGVARSHETLQIVDNRPLHNRHHNPDWMFDGRNWVRRPASDTYVPTYMHLRRELGLAPPLSRAEIIARLYTDEVAS